MTFFEFLYDVYIRACNVQLEDDQRITVERDLNNENLFVFKEGFRRDYYVYGVYKTVPDTGIDCPSCFVLPYHDGLISSLHQLIDEKEESHVRLVDDHVYDCTPNIKPDINGKHFGIEIVTNCSSTVTTTTQFYNCYCNGSGYFNITYKNMRDLISSFSSVDFSVKFSSDEVKNIVKHFNKDSIVQNGKNSVFFRRCSNGKLYLECCDGQHSYSVHTDCDIEEDILYIPLYIRIREFISVLKTCSGRGLIFEGKGFSNDSLDAYLKVIDEDDFARYEYWFPFIPNSLGHFRLGI